MNAGSRWQDERRRQTPGPGSNTAAQMSLKCCSIFAAKVILEQTMHIWGKPQELLLCCKIDQRKCWVFKEADAFFVHA